MATEQLPPSGDLEDPPERILSAGDDLFTARGIDQVGVDELVAHSEVAKATFYRYFHSKDDLALAYLRHWHQERSSAIDAAVKAHGGASEDTLWDILAHVVQEWLRAPRAEVSAFVHFTAPTGRDDAVGQAYADYFSRIHEQIAELARDAGLHNPDAFARSWQIITRGAMVAAIEGDPQAGELAQRLTAILVDSHR